MKLEAELEKAGIGRYVGPYFASSLITGTAFTYLWEIKR